MAEMYASWLHSYRANPESFCERRKRVRPGRHEFVSNIAPIVQVRDRHGNCVVIQFLAVIDFVATGYATGMKVSDPLDIVANRPEDISLHDLHMIDVVQQFDVR